MSCPVTFDNAVNLAEEVLAHYEDPLFCLQRIPNIHALICSFSSRQLAFFCRVLALVVHEPEQDHLQVGVCRYLQSYRDGLLMVILICVRCALIGLWKCK